MKASRHKGLGGSVEKPLAGCRVVDSNARNIVGVSLYRDPEFRQLQFMKNRLGWDKQGGYTSSLDYQ